MNNADFVVHTIVGSPFARSVMATLEEKQAPWRLAPIALGGHLGPEHLTRHAFAKVPVLDHGAFSLYETAAILRYIDRVIPEPRLTPSDAQAAARMDQLMSINEWYLFANCANIIAFQRVVGPALMGITPDEAKIAEAMPRAHRVFAELSRLLGDQQWMAGDKLTLADLHLGPQIDFMAQTPEWAELTADKPNLVGWLERLEARPSMQVTTWERVSTLAKVTEPA